MVLPSDTYRPPRDQAPQTAIAVTGFILVAIAALYLGRGIFVPLVLATLLAFALAPVVSALRRLRLPRMVATIVTLVLAAAVLVCLGYLVVTQLMKLAADLPQYQLTIAQKIRDLQETADGGGVMDRLAGMIERLGAQAMPEPAGEVDPIPVTIANVPPSPLDGLQGMLGTFLGPLATFAIVSIFAIFLLLQREDLGDRFLKLVSRGDLPTTTKVVKESAARVSRYLLVQLMVNSSYGVIFGAALWLLGVPNAILWGLFATFLRYIPFVGTMLAVAFPAAVAFAVDPGWWMLLGVLGLYFGMELVTTNFLEPRLYGSSTGLSPLAVLVAAIFWATLWGPIGLILSTPLTVCLVVLGRYVPQLSFLEIVLGSEPVLRPEEKLYQRLLAGNVEEAVEMAEAGVKESGIVAYYDDVVIPALRLAEADLQHDAVDFGPRRTVAGAVSGVIADISELVAEEPEQIGGRGRVLALGGKTELDGAAAEIVAQAAALSGFSTLALPPVAVRPESIGQLDLEGADVACLCYLGPNPRSYVRYVAARLRRRRPQLRIIACLIGHAAEAESEPAELRVDAITTDIASTERTLRGWLRPSDDSEPGAVEEATTAAVAKLKELARREGWLEQRCAGIAKDFGATLALATVADETGEKATGKVSQDDPSQQVMATREPMVIEDVSADPDFADNPYLLENGVLFYAAEPLVTSAGVVVGALSIVDDQPRRFGKEERIRFAAAARRLMVEFEAREEAALAKVPPERRPPASEAAAGP
ncbi:MAG TPA: AI-2E family transporter [Devosiaceae bacterium]|nr:AI-2E family transporter [Devosiaceae bacterium]